MELSNRQQEIVKISIDLIADKGIQNLTIKNISDKIGISEPAIYRHFKNKFEIVMSVLDTFASIAGNVLNNVKINNLKSYEKIELFIMDRYERCSSNPKLAKVMFSEEFFQNDALLSKKMLSIMHSHKNDIERILISGQADGEIRNDIDTTSIFRIVFGAMRLLIKQWCLSGFKFDLIIEGKKLWEVEKKLIINS